MNFTRYTYPRSSSDVALPLGTTEYTLFETGHDGITPPFHNLGHQRYIGYFWNSQAGVLKTQFWDETAAAYRDITSDNVALTTTVANRVTAVIPPHKRVRVLWVNGGTNQTIFNVNHGFGPDAAAIS